MIALRGCQPESLDISGHVSKGLANRLSLSRTYDPVLAYDHGVRPSNDSSTGRNLRVSAWRRPHVIQL